MPGAPSSFLLLVVRPGEPLVAFVFLVAMPGAPSSFLLLVVRPGEPLVAFVFLVAMPGAPSSFLLLVVRPGEPLVASLQSETLRVSFLFKRSKLLKADCQKVFLQQNSYRAP